MGEYTHRDLAIIEGLPGGPVVKNLPANAGDMGPIPGLGRSHMPRGSSAFAPQLAKAECTRACVLRD